MLNVLYAYLLLVYWQSGAVEKGICAAHHLNFFFFSVLLATLCFLFWYTRGTASCLEGYMSETANSVAMVRQRGQRGQHEGFFWLQNYVT